MPVYMRFGKEPTQDIKEDIVRQLGVDRRYIDQPLAICLSAEAASLSKTVVLILDQFEEFFLRFSLEVRQPLHHALGACLTARLDVRIIIALREDYFARLAGFQEAIPNLNSLGASGFNGLIFRGDTTRARGLTGFVSNQWDPPVNVGTANNSAPHADSCALTFDANGNLIEVSDGDITRHTSPGDNTGDWLSINNNLQITEFISIGYDASFNILLGGAQDNAVSEQVASGSTTWTRLNSGDGSRIAVDDSVAGISVRYYSRQNLGGFTRRICSPVASRNFLP